MTMPRSEPEGVPSDGDYLRWAVKEGAKHGSHNDPRVVFETAGQWGRFCDRIRAALAAPPSVPAVNEPSELIAAAPEMLAALHICQRLVDEALPKFNWGASALDANAIQLLNEAPGVIAAAIASTSGEKSEKS